MCNADFSYNEPTAGSPSRKVCATTLESLRSELKAFARFHRITPNVDTHTGKILNSIEAGIRYKLPAKNTYIDLVPINPEIENYLKIGLPHLMHEARDGLLEAINTRKYKGNVGSGYQLLSPEMAEQSVSTLAERIEQKLRWLHLELGLDDTSLRLKSIFDNAPLTVEGGSRLSDTKNRMMYCLKSTQPRALTQIFGVLLDVKNQENVVDEASRTTALLDDTGKLWVTTENPFLIELIASRQQQRQGPPRFTR